jgi:xanthine dehydrogenase molybdopterin-binding subunit B
MTADPAAFRFVSTHRRVREDRRFVAGHGRFVADVALEGLLHVAILPSQHPAARIVSIDASAALAMPGVYYVLSGDELAAATDPLMNGLDTPLVRRHPLAVGHTRYAGEWVVAVVAETRPLAEDASEKSLAAGEPTGASLARLQRAARPHFRVGRGRKTFCRERAPTVVPRHLGAQLHRSNRDLRHRGILGSVARHAGCVGLDPDAEISRPDRARAADPGQ